MLLTSANPYTDLIELVKLLGDEFTLYNAINTTTGEATLFLTQQHDFYPMQTYTGNTPKAVVEAWKASDMGNNWDSSDEEVQRLATALLGEDWDDE